MFPRRKAEEEAERERKIGLEKVRQRELAEAEERREVEKRRREEEEDQRQRQWEQKRSAAAEERARITEAREAARRKAEELRQREEMEEEAGRRARELHRKQALEELQRFKKKSQAEVKEASKEGGAGAGADDKENIPTKYKEENKKLLAQTAVKGSETDSTSAKVVV